MLLLKCTRTKCPPTFRPQIVLQWTFVRQIVFDSENFCKSNHCRFATCICAPISRRFAKENKPHIGYVFSHWPSMHCFLTCRMVDASLAYPAIVTYWMISITSCKIDSNNRLVYNCQSAAKRPLVIRIRLRLPISYHDLQPDYFNTTDFCHRFASPVPFDSPYSFKLIRRF